ncbi:reverse transcriptase domain-containing protein [Tanacetum coccineum]
MRTRNFNFPNNSNITILRRQNRGRAPNIFEPKLRTIVEVAPGGIVIKMERATFVHHANPFFIEFYERKNPHAHINSFKRITSTLRFRDVPNHVIRLMMFPYSLEGNARLWYEKEPPNSILTWEDLVTKFVNQFFPPSKTTHLKNKISRFTQKFEETFSESWERFKEILRACPHHGFMELTQVDTFYNGLNENDQDSLNATAGGNLLSKTTREALNIIENKSKVRYSRNKSNVSRMNTTSRESVRSTAHIPPSVNPIPIPEPDVPKTLPKLNIPFAPTIRNLLMNKEKLLELAKIPLNKNFSAMLLKKLPKKLGDPGKFLIPCNFPGIDGFLINLRVAIPPRRLRRFTSEFILEEIEAYLKDDSISPEIDHADCNPEGDICLIEKLLNNDPFQLPPMDLKQGEIIKAKPSMEEPPELELKDLPSHLEYAYLEENDKLPVIIAKGLKDDEKYALLKVLKSHKQAIAWKITDIKGIDPRFCTHKILMEDDYKPTVQSQRRVNPKIHEVIKKEVLKLLDAGMIYPISDSPWISPVHCVPKKGRKNPVFP